MVANVGVAVGIVSPAHFVQCVFPLPVSVAGILNSVVGQHRKMSGNVDSVISKSGLVENVGVQLKSRRYLNPFKSYFRFRFYGHHIGFPVEGDVVFFR